MRFLFSLALLFLASCISEKQLHLDHEESVGIREVRQCKKEYENHILPTCVAMARCIEKVSQPIFTDGEPNADLLERINEKRMVLCKQVDAKKITYEQAETEWGKEGEDIRAEIAKRDEKADDSLEFNGGDSDPGVHSPVQGNKPTSATIIK